MTDPTRKKARASRPPELKLVVAEKVPADELYIVSAHPTLPGVLDLNEFSKGTLNSASKGLSESKGFSGRPELSKALAPYYRSQLATAPRNTVEGVRAALRAWWRLFEEAKDISPVNSLGDINELHGALAARAGFNPGYVSVLLKAVNPARQDQGQGPLHFIVPAKPTKTSELPDKQAIAAIYYDLKTRVRNCFARFERADNLAAAGLTPSCFDMENGSGQEAVVHSAYRSHVASSGNPLPLTVPGFTLDTKKGTPDLELLSLPVFGLYPNKADVQAMLLLVLLKTGWNAQTAIDIDATGEWLRRHPTSTDHHLIVGTKTRGSTEQVAIGLNRSELSPGNLLSALMTRTAPLRQLLLTQLTKAEAFAEANPSDEANLRVAELRRKTTSLWLFVDPTRKNAVGALKLDTYAQSHDEPVLRKWIRERNTRECLNASKKTSYLVPETITISDFRDAFVAFSYESSGFNWLVAKLAAGHTSMTALKQYLRQRQWKAHGERQVSSFMEHLWSEIRARRVVDPAVLRALMDRGEITEVQRQRWESHKDRTRIGVGCRDFKNPPLQVSPEHTAGAGCRTQRCTLCPHAVVFNDSVSHIARRLAELQFLQSQMPLTAWYESSFPDEVEATNLTLTLFPPDEVERLVGHWAQEIRNGNHRVLQFEGAYV